MLYQLTNEISNRKKLKPIIEDQNKLIKDRERIIEEKEH